MKAVKKITVGVFILALISLYIVIYAVPGLTGALTKTEILEYGNLEITDSAACYFIRNETVYMAARPGIINYYVSDAVHVKKGTKILDIAYGNTENQGEASEFEDIIARLSGAAVELSDYTTEFNGITSYFIDGYESFFTPETMKGLRYSQISILTAEPVNVVRNSTQKGEPLYKICDNREWYLVCWVDAGNISKYGKGNHVTIDLPLGQVRAEIADIIEDGGRWLIIFRTNRFYEDFSRVRSAEATVVIADFNGIIIRNESITTKDGEVGVYIKTKSGTYVFRPVKVVASDGKSTVVEVSYFYDDEGSRVGTVNIYDEILINP